MAEPIGPAAKLWTPWRVARWTAALVLLLIPAVMGAFAAWFRPAGMARAMLGVAVTQALVGVAIATAPVMASVPNGAFRALAFSGFFAALWLISALCFRAAVKGDR
jgi:hypothetical protein